MTTAPTRDELAEVFGYNPSSRTVSDVLGYSPRTILRWYPERDWRSTVRGQDGETYPRLRLGDADQRALITGVHRLRHEGRSVRGVMAELDARGLHRSVGWVSSVLRRWRCPECREENAAPEQAHAAAAASRPGRNAAPEQHTPNDLG